jgi:penicillin-binding protein 1A
VSVNGTDYLQAALVFMDPRTGDVRALIGGRDYHDSQFNRAFNANRQMASTFKPFVAAAAIAAGYPPSLRLSDQPLRMNVGGKMWSPENDDGKYHDIVTMRQALAASSNVATVRLANMVGLDRGIQQAKLAGMTGPFPSGPSVVLGSVEATPLELTTAYATFATLGKQPQPRLVTRVLDANGKVLWRQQPVVKSALHPSVAFLVNEMLKDVIDSGTAMPSVAPGIAASSPGTRNIEQSADFGSSAYRRSSDDLGSASINRKRSYNGGWRHRGADPERMTRSGDPGPDWKVPPGVD